MRMEAPPNLIVVMQPKFFTLAEIVIVLVVLVGLASIITPLVSQSIDNSRARSTALSLLNVREAIMGSNGQPGYWHHLGEYPRPGSNDVGRHDNPQLHFLFVQPDPSDDYSPATGLGWNGPYLQAATGTYALDATANFDDRYGEEDDRAMLDAWGNPIVLQLWEDGADDEEEQAFARLISAGPNGKLDTDALDQESTDMPTTNDDLVIYLQHSDSLNLDESLKTWSDE